MIVTAAYGKLLPREILDIPKYGCFNIHASLLPRLRGAAPIQRAIIAGDHETGVSIMCMEEGLDTGDIILCGRTRVGRKTAQDLFGELAGMGASLILQAIRKIETKSFTREPQDENFVTYAPPILKKEGLLNFNDDPDKIDRLVRGLDPWPGAYTLFRGEVMKIWETIPVNEINTYKPGTITNISKDGIETSAGGKTLRITGIQMPGKKKLRIGEFLKGNKIEKFEVLG